MLQFISQLADALSQKWMLPVRCNLTQGAHHEVTLMESGMWQCQLRRVDNEVVSQDQIDINDPVGILTIHTFCFPPHLIFYLPGNCEYCININITGHFANTVQKIM